MSISSVSLYIRTTGNYTVYIYKDNTSDVANQLCSQNFTATTTGWYDVELASPVLLDVSKDLWVAFFSSDVEYPATYGSYRYYNTNAQRIGASLEELGMYFIGKNISWTMKVTLTDGTYTYHLYDNGVSVADDIATTSYTVTNPATNTAHQYTVKTNYYGGETAASNMAGLTLGTVSVANLSLGANDKMTVTTGSTLTVSGTMSNNNAANLVLEDGAQLIHSSSGVKATVKKTIEPYTADDNGWNFIASPVTEAITPSVDNGLLSGTYDLYYYDEPTHYWKNHKQAEFTIAPQKGYLYANNATTTLQFAGTLTPSNSGVNINNLSHEATILNGFNLVGNPFACNATINQDCYVIDGKRVVLASGAKTFAPCEGAFVKADSDAYTVTFSKPAAKANSNGTFLDLVVSQGSKVLDRARVRIGESTNFEKFSLEDDNGSQLSFWQEGQEYAVVRLDGQNEMPLNFKAAKDGAYVLDIETNNLDLDYLHLIDNRTGADVDLLATPSYSFEAKKTDYASRFKLVFSNEENAFNDNKTFAYFNDGNIVVNKEGTLQIVDMTGRMIYQGDAINRVSTNGMVSGVYVLRLVTADGVKTQKLVIE